MGESDRSVEGGYQDEGGRVLGGYQKDEGRDQGTEGEEFGVDGEDGE